MKTILIIYPHWPPSNLAGVHRARLIANFLPQYNFHPIVLTVNSKFYEEKLDPDIIKTVSPEIEVVYTHAKRVRKPRIIGDIGLRAYPYLKKEALNIIKKNHIDFIWIPIPSFYTALLGRQLYHKTKIPYGIDYIDPWVRDISNRANIRAILSLIVAKIMEPIAIKNASLISGVAKEYFLPAIKKNFHPSKEPLQIAMPYGFDPHDHEIILKNLELPWQNIPNCKAIVYAGAFLPNATKFTKMLFSLIKEQIENNTWDKKRHLFFLGTGNYPHKSVSEFAHEFGISEYVHEIKQRFPFLHILNFLSKAEGILVIGSTEKHYTASKIYQSILSKKPIFAIFHHESTVCNVLNKSTSDQYLVKYIPSDTENQFKKELKMKWENFILKNEVWQANYEALNKYSAKQSAKILAQGINAIIQK